MRGFQSDNFTFPCRLEGGFGRWSAAHGRTAFEIRTELASMTRHARGDMRT